MDSLHIFCAVIGLAVNTVFQICIFRYYPRIGLLKSIVLGFMAGVLTVLFIESLYFSVIEARALEIICSVVANLITYFALGYCYFNFVNLGETARRIRILMELVELDGGLSMEGILQRYNAKEIIKVRIDRLVRNGQIICKGNRYYIGRPFVLWMAKVMTTLKFIILWRKSKFEEV